MGAPAHGALRLAGLLAVLTSPLTVLAWAAAGAGAAALGAAPFAGGRRLPLKWVGWANALAAGLMLGGCYTLIMIGLDRAPAAAAAGAVLGVAFVAAAHAAAGVREGDLASHGRRALLVAALHAAPEGVAIGGAMVAGQPFGIFVALAIAVHNVPEGAVLSDVLTRRGAGWARAAALAVAANLNQVLFAVASFGFVSFAPALLPWALGAAAGAFLYLVMSDLLPECYRQAGRTSIALVTAVAMAALVLLGRWVPLP